MCGIAGIFRQKPSDPNSPELLDAMLRVIRFRGPDGNGRQHLDWEQVHGDLMHSRLTIIDLSTAANQPMLSNDQRVCITFNGEIYNYRELRKQLIDEGATFRTESDTEVIIQGYLHWGMHKTAEALDGMFAFALTDQETRTIYLVRDRFGKKPLYVSRVDSLLAFGSDIRSVELAVQPSQADAAALNYLFYDLSTPGSRTCWQEISKVGPGTIVTYNERLEPTTEVYWEPRYATDKTAADFETLVAQTEASLRQAVRKRLVADVPVGVFLSGGVDSSLITAMAAQECPGIVSYSVGFAEEEYNELPYARQVAAQYDTRHEELIVSPEDIGDIDLIIDEFGEPFADSSMLPTYLVCKAAGANSKVVMGGDGGDEIFAGYPTYSQGLRFHTWATQAKALRPLAPLMAALPVRRAQYLAASLRRDATVLRAELDRSMGFRIGELGHLFRQPDTSLCLSLTEQALQTHLDQRANLFDTIMGASLRTRLLDDYLVKVDRASMFASLEVRAPFLDRDLFDLVGTFPPEMIMKGGERKAITKALGRQMLPVATVDRPKMGFGIPIGEWFKTSLKSRWEAIVLEGKQELLPMNYTFVRELFEAHCRGEHDHRHKLWALYVFHRWAQRSIPR